MVLFWFYYIFKQASCQVATTVKVSHASTVIECLPKHLPKPLVAPVKALPLPGSHNRLKIPRLMGHVPPNVIESCLL